MTMLESALWILAALALPWIAAQDSSTVELCKINSNGCSVPFNWIECPEHFRTACDNHDTCYVCGAHFGLTRKDCDDGLYKDIAALCAQGLDDEGYCLQKRKRREASSMFITTPLRQLLLLEKRMSDHNPRQLKKSLLTCAQWVPTYYYIIQAFGQNYFNKAADASYCPKFKPCMPEVLSTA
uniref:Conodipine 7 n=1 Tax=Conus geographus TaxID=6491 RepID=W4VRZ5_CONGE